MEMYFSLPFEISYSIIASYEVVINESPTNTNNIGYLNDGRILVSYYFADPYVEPSEDEGAVDDSLSTEGEDSEIMNEGDYSYEEPEFKYAVIETDGTITDIDLDLESYNDGEESWGYNTFKCAPNGDVFFFTI